MRFFYNLGYRYFKMPWDSGPRSELVELVESGRIAPCKAVDLGCGTGSNAIFLAQHGFDTTGVDYSSAAIDKAKEKALEAGASVRWLVDDLTAPAQLTEIFDFVVDYGVLDDLGPRDRPRYARTLLGITRPGSRYLLWCFEWQPRPWERLYHGRVALRPGEAVRRFGRYFDIERIAGSDEPNWNEFPPGYAAYLMTRKDRPASQP